MSNSKQNIVPIKTDCMDESDMLEKELIESMSNTIQMQKPIKTDRIDEPDIFADLEKTLCESVFNATINAKPLNTNQPSEQDVIDCLENVKDLGRIHGPAIRVYNLYKATMAFKEKRYLDSVYCETFALSLWMRIKYHANKVMEAEHHMPTEENLLDFLDKQTDERPLIIDYIDRFLKDKLEGLRDTSTLKSIEFTNGTELMNLCNELPKEWTVIQLCKQVNLEIFTQTRNDALRCPGLIFMTMFCYPMSERFNHQPIKIALNQKDLKELYDISRDYSEKMAIKDVYNHFRNISNKQFNLEIVSKLKKLLGPWIVLFSGKSKYEADKTFENQMIAKVDRFLSESKHKYSPLQNVLICLITRRLYMLTHEDIKEGALYISTTKEEWFELMNFFYEQKPILVVEECYPVILVVDEQIDFFYWEMCNPNQEFTRVDSMVTLLKLYFQHQGKISNGYYNVNQRIGSAVLNPGRDLGHFNTHIHPVMKKSKALTWNVLAEKVPTSTELKTMLANSDIYFYCGHGSGLQFISPYENCQLYTNAVVFLMGCSSTEFRSDCGYALGSATHQYYHIAKSPAVVGNLNITYLNVGVLFSNVILTKWLCVTNEIDLTLFGRKDIDKKFVKELQDVMNTTKASKYLPKVIAECRLMNRVPISFRAILCYRGLPVCLNEN